MYAAVFVLVVVMPPVGPVSFVRGMSVSDAEVVAAISVLLAVMPPVGPVNALEARRRVYAALLPVMYVSALVPV